MIAAFEASDGAAPLGGKGLHLPRFIGAQSAKQLFGFLGCEDCGGFVQNQHLGPTVQGFEDFQLEYG